MRNFLQILLISLVVSFFSFVATYPQEKLTIEKTISNVKPIYKVGDTVEVFVKLLQVNYKDILSSNWIIRNLEILEWQDFTMIQPGVFSIRMKLKIKKLCNNDSTYLFLIDINGWKRNVNQLVFGFGSSEIAPKITEQ